MYPNWDTGPTARLLIFTIFNFRESPIHIAGNGGETAIVNWGITVAQTTTEPEQIDVAPVRV